MNRNEAFSPMQVSTLEANLSWASLDVMVEDVEQIQVCISGAERDVKELRVVCQEGTLLVEQPAYGIKTLGTEHWMQIILRVPHTWKGAADLGTISAPLSIRGLTGTDFILHTISGDLTADGLRCMTAALRSVSGHVKGTDLAGQHLSLRNVSGDSSINGCAFEDYRTNAVSGDVTLNMAQPFEKLEGISVAGSIRVNAPVAEVNAVLHSVTGRLATNGVTIQPEAPEASLSSVSGNLEINCSTAAAYEEE